MANLQTKPAAFFKPDPNQPRKSFDEADLDRLGADLLARGILVPLLAKADGTIIDGERRWRAAQRVGMSNLPVIVTDKLLADKELRGIQLATVFHKADLSPYEKWLAFTDLLCGNPTWQMKDLAEFLHIDPSMVTRWMSPGKCIPAVQEALKEGKIGISDCYAISRLPESEQAPLLALKLSGASRDTIEQAGRKKRSNETPAVKLSRVKIAMPQGASVVISGNDLSMSDVVELLVETLKEARKAAEQYDVKTFQSMMRDKAKAG
jgi:ParB/RepB/Spo0J family partition protein